VIQHVSSTGLLLWGGGVTLCDAAGASPEEVVIVSDFRVSATESRGAIVAWKDYRHGGGADIYLQAVNGSGTPRFATNGIPVSTAGSTQEKPVIVSDGIRNAAGIYGAIVTWMDWRNGPVGIYSQRINSSGTPSWTADGIQVATSTTSQSKPLAINTGSGVATVTWADIRIPSSTDIFAQRIGPGPLWLPDGIPLCRASGHQAPEAIVSDGLNGAIVAWGDPRVSTEKHVMAQRIDASGTTLWAFDGVAVAGESAFQASPVLVSGPPQGAIVIWKDYTALIGIRAQAIDANGAPLWTAKGVPLRGTTGDITDLAAVPDGSGGAIAVWNDRRSGLPGHLYANHVTATGGVVDVPTTSFERIRLLPASPNPTRSTSRWTLELPASARVTSRVHDVDGRLVRVVLEGETYPAGRHVLEWDGTDATGARVPNGVYFVSTRVAGTQATSRVLMLR
jgi:hypothetical protein